jgi:hypothetical protein
MWFKKISRTQLDSRKYKNKKYYSIVQIKLKYDSS